MQQTAARHDGRSDVQVRTLRVERDIFEHAAASLLYCCGKTKVLCAVTMQQGVPHFLRGSGSGWLTAEYGMLPASTLVRTPREASTMRRSGRTVEISRVIGRVLRAVATLDVLGERTIIVDCDVLQADAGTRTASITAASLALCTAQERWLADGTIAEPIITDEVGAVSVGLLDGRPIVDPDYAEDKQMAADLNFVLTRSGKVIEIQGGAEKEPISWQLFEQLRESAMAGVQEIFSFVDTHHGRAAKASSERLTTTGH